jgi:hypothetical protein
MYGCLVGFGEKGIAYWRDDRDWGEDRRIRYGIGGEG